MAVKDLCEVKNRLLKFRRERDWEQFHDPKNLAEAISIEAAELLEIFLWKNIENSRDLTKNEIKRVSEEISDIFIYMIFFCEELNIDLLKEVMQKMEINAKKYPVEKAKGNSEKYTKF